MSARSLLFGADRFGPVFGPLLGTELVPELGPGCCEESKRMAIEVAVNAGLEPPKIKVPAAARAFTAGVWLLFDFLDESHEISQSLPDEWGAYWHGIMHRREPDPGNATYWFRRIGENPIHSPLRAMAIGAGYNYRDPFEFIEDCERHRGSGSDMELRLRVVQLAEMKLLLRCHLNEAIGDPSD